MLGNSAWTEKKASLNIGNQKGQVKFVTSGLNPQEAMGELAIRLAGELED